MEDTRKLVGKCGMCGTKVYQHNEDVTGMTSMCEECYMEASDWGLTDDDMELAF